MKGTVGGIKLLLLCTVSGVERRIMVLVPGGGAVLDLTTSFSQESTLGFLMVASLEEWRGRMNGTP